MTLVQQPNDIRRLGKTGTSTFFFLRGDCTTLVLEVYAMKKTGPTHPKSASRFGLEIVVSYLCYSISL